MHGRVFDEIIRRAKGAITRRATLRQCLGAAAAIASVLMDGAPGDVAAARRRHTHRNRRRKRAHQHAELTDASKRNRKKPCPPCKKRVKGKCKRHAPNGSPCPTGACQSGRCLPAGPTCSCEGRSCGEDGCGNPCGKVCDQGFLCQAGQCVRDCAPGLTMCSDECVNVRDDPQNCGACGSACAFPHAEASCEAEVCAIAACDPGYANCDGQPATGCETHTATDPVNCGACGTICPQNSPRCLGGTCVCPGSNQTCDVTATCCDDGCHNLQRDESNCGACGHECEENERCWAGNCVCGDVCTDGCQYPTLQAAITDAPLNGGTILICAGTYTGAAVIDKNLTLAGAGVDLTILDGEDLARPLEIAEGITATIRDLTITRGNSSRSVGILRGGGVLNHGALTIEDARITDCRAVRETWLEDGGAIFNQGVGTLVMRRCTVARNESSHGAIDGSTFAGRVSVVTVTDSLIEENQGGGLYFGANGTLIVERCTFRANNARGSSGGGVSMDAMFGSYRIVDTVFRDNRAAAAGGFHAQSENEAIISGCTVTGNWGGNDTGGARIGGRARITDCTFSDNETPGGAGGLSVGHAVLTNCTIADNRAGYNCGGGLLAVGDVTLQDCVVSGNWVNGRGGGICTDSSFGSLTLRDTDVTNNTAEIEGGGIMAIIPVALEDGTTVAANHPDNCSGTLSCPE